MRATLGTWRLHVQVSVGAKEVGNRMQEAPPHPMNLPRLTIALSFVVLLVVPARNQDPPQLASRLIDEVVQNELTDRVQQRKWMYEIDKREGNQTLTEEQVDTKDGPIYRVLAIDGARLSLAQREQDNARIDRLLHDSSQQLKLKRGYDEDERKLEKLMQLMPQAFLYDYDGLEGNLVRLRFRPNSAYNPPTYEAQVAHSLAGTILIDSQNKRLARLSGQLMNRVEFGYGLLGHINNGGTIEIGRLQVGPSEWKTALINIQLSGRLVFFKTIDKQQHETRSHFREVSGSLSLSEASQLLVH